MIGFGRKEHHVGPGRHRRRATDVMAMLLLIAWVSGGRAIAQSPSPAEPRPSSPRGDASADPCVDTFADLVAAIRPSVLAVGTYHFKHTPTAQYFGSGFVIGDGNMVVTNAHVVDMAIKEHGREFLTVFKPESRPREGRRAIVVVRDPFHDVAVMRIAGPPLSPLRLNTKTRLRPGRAIGILGYPIGMRLGVIPAVHKGVVSAVVPAVRPLPKGAKLTPELARAIRHPYDLYQLDLVVYPGSSGSPLFDARTGEVVGIINKTLAARTREHLLTRPSGIAYAVPSRWIDQLLMRIRAESAESVKTGSRTETSDQSGSAGD